MDRFYVTSLPDSGRVELSGPEAHHLRDVRRLRKGSQIILFDGTGAECVARLEKARRELVVLHVMEKRTVSRELNCRITLAVAPPKGDKMDTIVRKCAELGALRIVPTISEFTVLKPGEHRLERWRRIAIEASKQSGRNVVTQVEEPVPFNEVLPLAQRHAIAIMPDLSDDATPIQPVLEDAEARDSALCLIGPEGGFSQSERALAEEAGFVRVRLVPSILTTEAAAVAAASMLAYALR